MVRIAGDGNDWTPQQERNCGLRCPTCDAWLCDPNEGPADHYRSCTTPEIQRGWLDSVANVVFGVSK